MSLAVPLYAPGGAMIARDLMRLPDHGPMAPAKYGCRCSYRSYGDLVPPVMTVVACSCHANGVGCLYIVGMCLLH